MEKPLPSAWRGMAPSPALEADIRERVAGLEQFCDHVKHHEPG